MRDPIYLIVCEQGDLLLSDLAEISRRGEKPMGFLCRSFLTSTNQFLSLPVFLYLFVNSSDFCDIFRREMA